MPSDEQIAANDPFQVSSSAESTQQSPEFEASNVLRVAALSSMFGTDSTVVSSVFDELTELGFSTAIATGERMWGNNPERERYLLLQQVDLDVSRVQTWQRLNETAQQRDALSFLVAVMGSPLERESTAAAVALLRQLSRLDPGTSAEDTAYTRWLRRGGWVRNWFYFFDMYAARDDSSEGVGNRLDLFFDPLVLPPSGELPDGPSPLPWDGEVWRALTVDVLQGSPDPRGLTAAVWAIARLRVQLAERSDDEVTSSLAAAAALPADSGPEVRNPTDSIAGNTPEGGSDGVSCSTIVHGTGAWKGEWWEPDLGDFHHFIRGHRPDVYNQGAPFSWDGALKRGHRGTAARRLAKWASAMAPSGLQTVFAHSYGAEVAVKALSWGVTMKELVMLSAPPNSCIRQAAAAGQRIIDVRLRFDPVLGLVGVHQRLPDAPAVTPVVLRDWRLGHSATHSPSVWADEQIAARAGL